TSAADGRALCFATWGEPDGRPVFHLHGTPGCRLLGARRIEHGLEELLRSTGVRLITYDRPGWGGSDRHAGRRVVDCAKDVAAIADSLGLERFAVEGGSSGAPHALAAAALLPDRVFRVACVAPMAPYDRLGHQEWSRGQSDGVQQYVAWCLEGKDRMAYEFSREDAEMRASASPEDPKQAEVFEQTRHGIWGWVDDEIAAFQPWGFDPAAVAVPARVWHDPDDPVLPSQHAAWLGQAIPGAEVVVTRALGHGSKGDPRPDWDRLYSWLGS
ncbi:MAG: alpha/beta hydrolase, partial [Candidatus Dormibacteraeota bacterium]|nr:alpha/beta hydrolase [Candidatus Dormibacteraeota bacterium]